MQEIRNYKGCVYFLRHKGMSPVKIGMSNSDKLSTRITYYETASPYGVEILGTIPTDTALELEREIHEKLKSFRLKGEWFEITNEIVNAYINMYADIDVVNFRKTFEYHLNNSVNTSQTLNIKLADHFSVFDMGKGCLILSTKDIFDYFKNEYDIIISCSVKELSDILKDIGFIYKNYSQKKGFKLYLK